MSFFAPASRVYHNPDLDQLPNVHPHNPPRFPMNISSFDPLPLSHEPPPPDHPANRFPKVGETRCYWTLLSSDLRFIYLDPVLTHHLCEQAPLLIGKSVFDFVHPDEQASAKHDLGNVLESRTLHGSVTRMRFSRLSRVRRLLGHDGPAHDWPDAEKIALDTNYMAVDLVINWAAEGLVLCFLHAVVDLTPFDNDEHVKTGWSNWCSTPGVDHQEAQVLYQRLFNTIPQTGTMSRVFQILANQADRSLLMSWPPEQATGPTARDFARLSEEVQIGNSNLQAGSDAKTSCTRRYKALQNMTSSDGIREVESIFVPHGSIIFACHKVNVYSRNTSGNPPPMPQSNYDPSYLSSNHHQYYDSPYALPPMQSNPSYGSFMAQASQEVPTQYGSQQGWASSDPSPSQQTYQWPSASSSPPFAPSQQARPSSGSYSPHQQHQWPAQPSPYFEAADPLAQQYQRPLSPPFSISSSAGDNAGASPSVSPDAVPPPRAAQRRTSPSTARDSYGSGGRSSGNPPVGVTRCSSCKVTSSPEWRKGPSGKKDLCNACGLRYARSRAKKEGITAQRRRKEKVMVQAMAKHDMPSSHQPPSTPPISVPYSEFRRSSYDGSSLLSTSPSGSDAAYSHPGPSSFDSLTPSPSPPAHADFIHYGAREARAYSLGSAPFYSSSPLAAPPVQPLRTASGTPPMLPRASADTLLGTFPTASYEREREDPRQGKTTLLTQ